MDLHNICFVLRRRKEKMGPRSMRYELKPGEPVRILFDPWGTEVVCPRSIYQGSEPNSIRVWGRRRIHTLERLIPVAKKFTVHLLGNGLPSFYVADLGYMSFTLGLSGWTANDWSRAGNFDLMAPRADVDELTKRCVFDELKNKWFDTPDAIASRLKLDRSVVLGALSIYTQAGRAIYDLNKRVYRARELSREPLPMEKLRFSNEREEAATRFLAQKAVQLTEVKELGGEKPGTMLKGRIKTGKGQGGQSDAWLRLDADDRIVEAGCTCNFFQQNRLRKGPCEHMLALRLQHAHNMQPRMLVEAR